MAHPSCIAVSVVEDDQVFLQDLLRAIASAPGLRAAGHASTLAGGRALLQGAASDVLVVDLGLPDGSGLELVPACRHAWPHCAVLVSTVFGDEKHVLGAIRAGAAGYLLKDSTAPDLLAQIRVVHAGGSPISPLIARRVMDLLRGSDAAAAGEPPSVDHAGSQDALSPRESQVLRLASIGFTYEEIAGRLGVSRHTIQTFVRRIYAKLDVNSKLEAVNEARRQGFLRI